MKIRVLSLLLALVMAVMLIPAPVSAAALNATDIQQQIRSTYLKALRGSGRKDFDGHCGALVSWQTYYLGIDKKVYGCDGKNQYDQYAAMDRTTGGYRVAAYPASKYTLKQALNTLSKNGTKDVYNLVVGFQKTSTAAGSRYGHALFVHAILDGKVYFVECFDSHIAGRYVPEGQAIVCTIDQFCEYYDRWTVFDGIVHFGVKSYADMCTEEPATMFALVKADTYLYKEPGDPGIYEPTVASQILAGRWVTASALLKTPNGNYWYRVEYNGDTYYMEADALDMNTISSGDVTLSGLRVPTYLYQGNGFSMKGTVSSDSGLLQKVSVKVLDGNGQSLFYVEQSGQRFSVDLSSKTFNSALAFRKLSAGTYDLIVEATVKIQVYNDGVLETRTGVVELYHGQFRVVKDWNKYPVITFNGNGGDPSLDQIVVEKNASGVALPKAVRSGYAFAGWTLDKAGKKPVTKETVFTKNVTLYAQWEEGHAGLEGWQQTEDGWHYCDGEHPVEGWVSMNELQFYQYADGSLATGWVWVDEGMRYFNEAGALITQIQGPDGVVYYLNEQANGVLGWLADPEGVCPEISDEDLQQKLENTENLSATGRVMNTLSSGAYWMAIQTVFGQLPDSMQQMLSQK